MALSWSGGCGEGIGAVLYPTTGQNIDGAMTQKATSDTFSNYNNTVLKTLLAAGWVLNGTIYEQTLYFDEIYDRQPSIVPCGQTLGTPSTKKQDVLLARIHAVGDSSAKTITFYSSSPIGDDIYLSIQGVR